MTPKQTLAMALAAAAVAAMALPAEAAKKRKESTTIYYGQSQPAPRGRASTRITVHGRSYLDAGTETKRYDEHYMDYAFPRDYAPFTDRTDHKLSYDRMPFNNPFDVPGGYSIYGY